MLPFQIERLQSPIEPGVAHEDPRNFPFCVSFKRKRRLWERGATAVEYALLVGLISVGLIATVTTLRTKITTTLGKALNADYTRVATLAGTGLQTPLVDGPADTATFYSPFGVAADSDGNVFVADTYNNRIRKITSEGVVSTIAGDGSTAIFNNPYGLTVDGSGTIFVADYFNNRIQKVAANGVVTTFSGTGTAGCRDGAFDYARFYYPSGVVSDGHGNLIVSDTYCHSIRKIAANGSVTTIAGTGSLGFNDANGLSAQFWYPRHVAVDTSGTIYVADSYNHRIRKIAPNGDVSTMAGSATYGTTDGAGAAAKFYHPYGIVVDSWGTVYVGDSYNHRIRKITASGVVSTIGTGVAGSIDGSTTAARFYQPMGLALGPDGMLYVADFRNNRIRKIT